MSKRKIALWVFIALLISGTVFGLSVAAGTINIGGWNNMSFGLGKLHNVNSTKESDLTSVRRIEIDVSSPDTWVEFKASGKASATLQGNVRTFNPDMVPYLEMSVSGDTLRIAVKRKGTVALGFYSENLKLDIFIPEEFAGDLAFRGSSSQFKVSPAKLSSLTVKTTSGDVSTGDMELSSGLDIETSSGEITLDDIKAESATLLTSSGDVRVKSISVAGNATLKTSSGNIAIDSANSSDINYKTSSGDIRCGSVSASQTTAEASSGSINLGGLEGSASVTASSGDVTLNFRKAGDRISVACTSGRIVISLPGDAGFTLKAKTNSGSLKSEFTLDNGASDEDNLSGSAGGGETVIDLATSSGDIKVLKN